MESRALVLESDLLQALQARCSPQLRPHVDRDPQLVLKLCFAHAHSDKAAVCLHQHTGVDEQDCIDNVMVIRQGAPGFHPHHLMSCWCEITVV